MPWTAKDAEAKTKHANTPAKQRQWAHISNGILQRTGDEARAIREANAVMEGPHASKKKI
jgi:uncharacterized protein YdaT